MINLMNGSHDGTTTLCHMKQKDVKHVKMVEETSSYDGYGGECAYVAVYDAQIPIVEAYKFTFLPTFKWLGTSDKTVNC